MNNPNPFVPKGSLLELQSQRRSRLKIAVFCVLAVSVTGLTVMLINGCKRTTPDTEVPPPIDTNTTSVVDTNFMGFGEVSNPAVILPPVATNTTTVLPPVPPTPDIVVPPVQSAGSEYTVVKGDTLAKIAKAHGVSTPALQKANPSVVPTKLKIGTKLVIPSASTTGTTGTMTPAVASVGGSETVYTVKSGDTLAKIAKTYGISYKAIQSANGLATTQIKVGQKLKIPSKVEPAPLAPVPAPASIIEPASAPVLPPVGTLPPSTTGH